MNRIELSIKKDTFFGKLKKAAVIFKDKQTGEQHVIDITNVNFLSMKFMIQSMSTYREHDEFTISRDLKSEHPDALIIQHSKARYKDYSHLVAYISKSSFLEMIDDLISVKK
ncbi:TPA: hypothetical protein QCU60_001317 [Bacillus cereus]|nr:hypothetical protein [Bacillus cereus]